MAQNGAQQVSEGRMSTAILLIANVICLILEILAFLKWGRPRHAFLAAFNAFAILVLILVARDAA